MAGPRRNDILRHSVLDRLIGDSDGPPRGGDLRIGVMELRHVIRRDIEWLLNTRHSFRGELASYEEIVKSMMAYGLPDLSAYSLSSTLDSHEVCGVIRKAIQTFEPRLNRRSIDVEFVPNNDIDDFSMHFRISGVIDVDPIREPVTFDTSMDPNSGTVTVKEAD